MESTYLQRSAFIGNSCAYPSPSLSLPPCTMSCLPSSCPHLVGPTGPTGAIGPPPLLTTPAVVLSAALNAPRFLLTSNVLTTIPFNFVITSNLAAQAQFETSTGIFTVLVPGQYRIVYCVTFTGTSGALALAGDNLLLTVRQNQLPLSTATYTFPNTPTAVSTLSLSSFWTGTFNIGDKITISALWTSAIASSCTLVGPAVSGVGAFPTLFSLESLF